MDLDTNCQKLLHKVVLKEPHPTEKGRVTHFSVQLEVKVKDNWEVVVRYDCFHGFSHMDKYDIKRKQTKIKLNLSFESALTYGDWDINKNWLKYKQKFLRGMVDE